MPKYIISQHPEGISLNGYQHLLDENDELLLFDEQSDALTFLLGVGCSRKHRLQRLHWH